MSPSRAWQRIISRILTYEGTLVLTTAHGSLTGQPDGFE
jgi:hypothetical protein